MLKVDVCVCVVRAYIDLYCITFYCLSWEGMNFCHSSFLVLLILETKKNHLFLSSGNLWTVLFQLGQYCVVGSFAQLWIAGTACKCFEWDPCGNFQCEDRGWKNHLLLTEYTSLPDRQLSSLTVRYTMLKPTLVPKLWRDSEVTLLTGLKHMGRSCKDNYRIMTWVGFIFIFTANPLSPNSFWTRDCPSNNHT